MNAELIARLNEEAEAIENAAGSFWNSFKSLAVLLRAAAAALSTPRERYRHKTTGGLYEVLVPKALGEWNHQHYVVYKGVDTSYYPWIRPYAEFHDGRFERLPDAAPQIPPTPDREK